MQTIKLSSPDPMALKSEYIAYGLEVTCPGCKTTFVMTPTSPVCPGCQDRVRIEFCQE